ncbi:hypothetical protein [Umezawaea sp. Da 62-37]|uniref:hypothetical protein n=1 Tax=Umezawaea sp. Da 62-37 TaxID=3075927 RepID=UPI0028F6CB64|nr:hypothetical protein [Umezawaea sp. Da 62-37]WNV83948.1 hypothetical protein RM788_38160 [Umezawaea sp. Da 62-37]
MSAPTEDRGQLSHPVLGDLAQWQTAFLAYAAAAPTGNPYFPTGHVIDVPFDVERLLEGLAWFESRYGRLVGPGLLPDLETMRRALVGWKQGGGQVVGGASHRHPHVAGAGVALSGGGLPEEVVFEGVEVNDEGSPCHNFWHWLNGTS